MKRILFAALAALFVAALAFPCSSQTPVPEGNGVSEVNAAPPRTFDLTILHTNDWHGSNAEVLAKQTTLIDGIRAVVPNVLYLNAGDVFARGRYERNFHGELEFAVMNAQHTDALVLGNNDFKAADGKDPLKFLRARLSQSRFPVLAANVTRRKGGKYLKGIVPWAIVERGGLRIGILGLTAEDSGSPLQKTEFDFIDETDCAKALLPYLASRADIVIALTHSGFGKDRQLAAEVPGLAAIVGGHSHTFLQEPFMAGPVPIVQAGENATLLGRLDLHFVFSGERWALASAQGCLLPVAGCAPDPATMKLIEGFTGKTGK